MKKTIPVNAKAQWLDILQMRADWEQEKPVARILFKDGCISMQGEAEILSVLEHGITNQEGTHVFPKDGFVFLQAAEKYFCHPPYLFATPIRTGEEIPYVPQPWQDLTS